MRKKLQKLIRGAAGPLALAAAVFAPWQSTNAELLLNENFDYLVGDLYNANGPWYKVGGNTAAPIQVTAGSLTYEGYQDDVIGNQAYVTGLKSSQSLWRAFDDGKKIDAGTTYFSFLMNVNSVVGNNDTWVFNIFPESKKGVNDGQNAPTEFAKLFVAPGTDASTQFKLAISRNGNYTKSGKGTVDYNIGETYLVVIAYTFVDGSTNDKVELWVNPATDLTMAPEQPTIVNDGTAESTSNDASTSYGGLKGVEFLQSTSDTKCANVTFDALRAATTWSDLFPAKGDETVPAITLGRSSIDVGTALPGMIIPGELCNVSVVGTDLKGDITVTCPEGVTPSVTTISAADATPGNPYNLSLTVAVPDSGTDFSFPVVFSSDGAEDATFTITGNIIPVANLATAADINAKIGTGSDYENYYRYTGHAVVTYIEDMSTPYSPEFNIYAQDETGAICINTAYTYSELCPVAVGNEITNVLFMYDEEVLNTPVVAAMPVNADGSFLTVTATGKTVEPVVCDAQAMATDADVRKANIYKLLKVNEAKFSTEAGTSFAANKNFNFTTSDNVSGAVRMLSGSDLIGEAVPTENVSITGLSKSVSVFVLAPRMKSDIEVITGDPAELTLFPDHVDVEGTLPGMTVPEYYLSTSVSGKNLTGDITVVCPEGISSNVTTIAAANATEDNPAYVSFTLVAPTTPGDYTYPVVFKSEVAEDVTFSINISVPQLTQIANAAQIQNYLSEEYEYIPMLYTGKAVVTYIESAMEYGMPVFYIYAQDMFGGLKFSTTYTGAEVCPIAVGNEITDIIFDIESVMGTFTLNVYPIDAAGKFCTVSATDKTKTPAEVSIADMSSASLPSALYKLYTLKDVNLKDASGNFEANKSYTITDGTNEAAMRIFASSNVVGASMPEGKFDLTGISTSAGTFILMPRSTEDIAEAASAPAMSISREKLFDFVGNAAPINTETPIFKYTVTAENLPVELPVELTGTNANMFSVSPAVIPSGSSTTEITVNFKPTQVGKFTAGIFINADAINPELNYTSSFASCTAYDPENLPTITIEPAVIDLVCAPGNTVKGSAVLNAVNAFDYITATRSGTTDNGGITINNTYLMPNSTDVKLEVTFTPTAEGEFTETWTYTTTMGVPATLTVNAKCTGNIQEQPVEGDEEVNILWSNASVWYVQKFNAVESNKPLKVNDWSNVAVEGQRAWWGYVDATGLSCAKVTAYDSSVASGNGTRMVAELVSPALDYKNAAVKKLKFRLMGQYLTGSSDDILSIQMVDPNGDFYALGGFDIPTLADQAGEWIEYDVDMSAIEDMPDTFAIAFVFSGIRGRDNSTTYYIDDFQWGDDPNSIKAIAFGAEGLNPDADGYYNVYTTTGVRVLRTKNAADLQTLAPGLYITNGRKFIRK